MSKVLFATALALSLAPAVASASPVEGPSYTPDQIRGFAVGGVHPGMTADEAATALREAGYEGAYPKFVGTERSASVWVQVDRKAAPFRYVAADGKVRVYEMIFEQRFDRPQSIQALRDMVVAKYGTPTEAEITADQGKLTYHAPFTVDHLSLDARCADLYLSSICSDAERATLATEKAMPILIVSLTPTRLHAEISDMAGCHEGDAATKAAADAAHEAKALSNSKSTKLGL